MKIYELTYIISPDITSEEAEAKAREIEALIKRSEGSVISQSNPTAKTLSYPIKSRASGFFGILEFQIEPEKLAEIKESVSKDGKITRHMMVVKNPVKIKKGRRTRPAPSFQPDVKAEENNPPSAKASEGKEKVELKDIEQRLDEILGQ